MICILLVTRYSYVGLAIANLVTRFLLVSIEIILSTHFLRIALSPYVLAKFLIPGLIMIVVAFFMRGNVFLAVPASLFIYTAGLFSTGAAKRRDLSMLFMPANIKREVRNVD